MKKSIQIKTLLVVGFTIITLVSHCMEANAHYPWINLTDYAPEPGEALKITIGWGHHYPLDGFLKKDALENLSIIGPGKIEYGVNLSSEVEFMSNESMNKQGVYIVAGKRKAGFYTKTTEGGKMSSKKGLRNIIKCSHSHMCMKAIVNVGKEKGKTDITISHPMEIIPLANPAELKAGDYMPLQVLLRGKPFKGKIYATYIGFSTEKNTFAYTTDTDKKGNGRIKILSSGVWMIKTEHEEAYPDQSECDVESFVSTLTFEVK
ncbi:MAG: DUF4198 domain-containing protein [Thermodesulfobacteriota bacterium]|nr:DUF4198 domain-containing protein [Thermodesulfobacteriota bacterium]